MDFLFEVIFELIAEGTFELSKSSKVPRPLRVVLTGIVVLFCAAVIGIILAVGVSALKKNLLFGVLLLTIALVMLIMGVRKFRRVYLSRQDDNEASA